MHYHEVMKTLGTRIVEGLEEAVDYMEGQTDRAISTTYEVIQKQHLDVAAIRKGLDKTQKEFAAIFGISVNTLRSWEQKQRNPEHTSRLLLLMIRDEPEMVESYVAKLQQLAS